MKTAIALVLLCSGIPLLAADAISSAQAKDHLNETRTVCGRVADARYLETGSQATFLNFDKKYPQNTFLAFIATENRARFGTPEKQYLGKDICVTGKILEYNAKPEIVLTDPKQIRVQSK